MEKTENLNELFNIPGKCPVKGCSAFLIPMEMLAHLLMHHTTLEAKTLDVFAGEVSLYSINLDEMEPGQNHCIANLTFGHRPVKEMLEPCHGMPLMLMLYVTNWAALIASRFVEDDVKSKGSEGSERNGNMRVYLIYLLSCSTSRKSCADILAVDANRMRVCYGKRAVRNYSKSPLVATKLEPFGTDFLLFTEADVAFLNGGGSGPGVGQKQLLLRLVMRGEPELF